MKYFLICFWHKSSHCEPTVRNGLASGAEFDAASWLRKKRADNKYALYAIVSVTEISREQFAKMDEILRGCTV